MSKLDEIVRAIREDAYEDGGYGAGHPASIDGDKKKITDLFVELLGKMEGRETEDLSLKGWTNEDYKAFGRNGLRSELLKKINKL